MLSKLIQRPIDHKLRKRMRRRRTGTSSKGWSASRIRGRRILLEALEDRRLLTGFSLVDTLLSPNPTPQTGALQGASVATESQYHVAGKPGADLDGFSDSGAVEIYDATTNSHIVAIHNPTPFNGDFFGSSVAVSGERVVVGAPSDDTGATDAGSAYVYDLSSGSAVLEATLDNPTPADGDSFGISVGVSADRIVVGAFQDDTRATDSGAAYVFGPANEPPIAVDDLLTTDEDTAFLFDVLADNGNGPDSDPDGNLDASRTVAISPPTAGVLTNHGDGTFTYDPNGEFEWLGIGESATVSFEYRIEDAFGETDTATATLTIAGVNDTEVSLSANGNLVITDTDEVTNDNLTVHWDSANNQVIISDPNSVLNSTIPGATGSGTNTLFVPITSFSGVVIDTGGGDDTITLSGATALLAKGLDIDGGTGFDTVTFADRLSILSDGAVMVRGDTIVLAGAIIAEGDNQIDLIADRNISATSGASLGTREGRIYLSANASQTATGNFVGIDLQGTYVEATRSSIQLIGKGGDTGTGNFGIYLRDGTTITSVGVGPAAANIDLLGHGGDAADRNYGVFLRGSGVALESFDGDINVHGVGGAGTDVLNLGVFAFSGAQVSSSGSGNVTITGEGGGTNTAGNHGIQIVGTSTGVSTVDGNVELAGTGAGSSAMGVNVDSNAFLHTTGIGNISIFGSNDSIQVAVSVGDSTVGTIVTAAGAITMNTDSLFVQNGATIVAAGGSGSVTIQPLTAGKAISLGVETSFNKLALSDAELDRISAASIAIGSPDAGHIDFVTEPISLASRLTLLTGGVVHVFPDGGLSAGELAISAAQDVNLGTNFDVDSLAITSSDGSITVVDLDGFEVDDVAGQSGLSAANGITLTAESGDVVVRDTAAANDIEAGGISITLEGDEAMFRMDSGAAIATTSGGMTVLADKMDIAGTITTVTSTILRSYQPGQAIDVGAVADTTADTLELSDAELDQITAPTLEIGDASNSSIGISDLINLSSVDELRLIAGGEVTLQGSGGLRVDGLAILASGDISLGTSANRVDVVALDSSGGNINFANGQSYTVGEVAGVAGVVADGFAFLRSFPGDITVSDVRAGADVLAGSTAILGSTSDEAIATVGSGAKVNGDIVSFQIDDVEILGTVTASSQVNFRTDDPIDVGAVGDTQVGTMEISDAELDRITAPKVEIGRPGTASILISNSIDSATVDELRLWTGGQVNRSGSGSLKQSRVAIQAGGDIHLGSSANDVDVVSLTSTGGSINFGNSQSYAVGEVAGQAGVTASGGVALTAFSGDLTISDTSATTDVSAGSTVIFTGSANDATVSVAPSAHVSGNVVDFRVDEVDLAGTVAATSQVNFRTDDPIDIGAVGDTQVGTMEISDAELSRIHAPLVQIGRGTADSITISDSIAPSHIDAIHLITGGGVDAGSKGALAVPQLAISSVGPVSLKNWTLGNSVDVLVAEVSGTGSGIQFENDGALTLGTVDGISGITTNGGGITIITHSPLTVNQPIADLGGGNITLTATNDGGDDDNLTVNASVQASGGSGNVELNGGTNLSLAGGITVSVAGAGSIATTAEQTTEISVNTAIVIEEGSVTIQSDSLVVSEIDADDEVTLEPIGDTGDLEVTLNGTSLVLTPTSDGQQVAVETINSDGSSNAAPIANAGADRRVHEGDAVSFLGEFTDADASDTHSIVWDFGDGSSPVSGTLSPNHTYVDNGTYTVTLFVTDSAGVTGKDTLLVTVDNAAPEFTSVWTSAPHGSDVAEHDDVTITADFVDEGVQDTHTAMIDWGDGTSGAASIDQGSGSGTLTASHAYAAGGVYLVTITLVDDDGDSAVESTMAVISGSGIVDGVLYVIGTSGDDRVHINGFGRTNVKVHTDFFADASHRNYSEDDFDQIIVYLCDGDDHLTTAGNVTTPLLARGGDGDDRIHLAGGPAIVLGGAGDDDIKGGRGRNVLIGGLGSNTLKAGRGGDLLVGGSTNRDDDDWALFDLLELWNGSDSFDDRVDEVVDLLTIDHDPLGTNRLHGGASHDAVFADLDDVLKGNKKKMRVIR